MAKSVRVIKAPKPPKMQASLPTAPKAPQLQSNLTPYMSASKAVVPKMAKGFAAR